MMRTQLRNCSRVKPKVLTSGPAAAPIAPTTAAGTPATASFTRNHRTSFVHNQGAAHEVTSVAGFDGSISGSVVVDFNEAEPSGFARESIAHYIHAVYGNTRLREEIR
jgi:hypothetical protein